MKIYVFLYQNLNFKTKYYDFSKFLNLCISILEFKYFNDIEKSEGYLYLCISILEFKCLLYC